MGDATVAGEGDELRRERSDEHDDDAGGEPPVADEPPQHGRSLPFAPATTWAAAGVLAVLVAGLGVFLLVRGDSPKARRATVVRTSEQFAVALSSYDYRHLDRDFRRVRDMSTTGFQEEYDNVLGGATFTDALRKSRAVSKATIRSGPFVALLTDDEARTVTVVDQQVTNANTDQPQRLRTRVELYLVKTVKGWKIDRVSVTS